MRRRGSFLFIKKNKAIKKKLFRILVQKKKQEKIYKKTKKKIGANQKKKLFFRRKTNINVVFLKKKTKKKSSKNLFIQKTKKEEKKALFFLKKKLLWLKKKFYSCFSRSRWRFFFKRFRSYRFLYTNYTKARLYEQVSIRTSLMGGLLRGGGFPIKPMHFEFCYRRCEGVLLCSPQKWYNLSLLYPTAL